MRLAIKPRALNGRVAPPPSKSMAHRMLICAALAEGSSTISNVAFSDDIMATLRCLSHIGASWDRISDSSIRITGTKGRGGSASRLFECGESGSTLRFFIPIALALYGEGCFTVAGRLMKRPQGPYFDLFFEKGIAFSYNIDSLSVSGRLESGAYALRGDVSSQFFSGLLFALPLLAGDSTLRAATALESAPYVDMTAGAQAKAGVRISGERGKYFVRGGQDYRPFSAPVESDWTQAAFWIAANLAGSSVKMTGMDENSVQGDRAHGLAMAEMMSSKKARDLEFDISDCPDLLPPMAAAAALRGSGTKTSFLNAARLRIKESDRLESAASVINSLGGHAEEKENGLVIYGSDSLRGGAELSCRGDHRIAMMAAIAATKCEEPVALDGAECVNKSYPNFWEDYKSLGGDIEGI